MVKVMLYPCIFCIFLLMDLYMLCVECMIFWGGDFVVECYGGVECVWRCSVGYTVYGLPKHVCVEPVITVCI